MPKITYDNLKQQSDQLDPSSLNTINSLGNSTNNTIQDSTTSSSTNNSTKPTVNIPMDDFSYESSMVGKKNDLNKLLSFTDGGGTKKNNYAGSQVLINTDRIIVNSRVDYLMLFGEAGISISSPGNVNIDSDDGVTIFGEDGLYLGVPGKGLSLDEGGGNKKPPKTKADPTLDNDYEPMILGLKLVNLLEDLLITLKNATILTPTGKAYFRDDTMYDLGCLQARLPEMLSTFCYIDGLSHEATDPAPEPINTASEVPVTTTGTTVGPTSTATQRAEPGSATSTIKSPLKDRPDFYEANDPYNV